MNKKTSPFAEQFIQMEHRLQELYHMSKAPGLHSSSDSDHDESQSTKGEDIRESVIAANS